MCRPTASFLLFAMACKYKTREKWLKNKFDEFLSGFTE
jgi:hypothetical protein